MHDSNAIFLIENLGNKCGNTKPNVLKRELCFLS
jgi:hypothetical protein